MKAILHGLRSPSVTVPLNVPEIPKIRPVSRSLPTVAMPRSRLQSTLAQDRNEARLTWEWCWV